MPEKAARALKRAVSIPSALVVWMRDFCERREVYRTCSNRNPM